MRMHSTISLSYRIRIHKACSVKTPAATGGDSKRSDNSLHFCKMNFITMQPVVRVAYFYSGL
jgi:hypothetical protein